MKRTPFQLRRMYRAGLLVINPAAPLAAPDSLGKARVQTWTRVTRRAIRYLQSDTNSEQMAKVLKGVNRNTITPQAIRQDLTKGFAILLLRGYLKPVDSLAHARTQPVDQWPAHNSDRSS